MKRVWSRSVTVDDEGIPWTRSGVRADFIFVLFMHGFSTAELQNTLLDGFHTDAVVIEDAIRWGRWNERQKARAAPKRSKA